MENRIGKSGGVEIGRKSKSLDLQSLYKSKGPVEEEGKKKVGVVKKEEGVKKKRKSRKEVALSSFEPERKKNKKSSNGLCGDRLSSGSNDSVKSQSGLSQRLSSSNGFNSISLSLDGNGNVFQIPKRPRGSVGRRRIGSNQISKSSGWVSPVDQDTKLNGGHKKIVDNEGSRVLEDSDNKASFADRVIKLNSDSAGKFVSVKVKQKVGFNDSKENRSSSLNSNLHSKVEDGQLAVNNGDTSSRRSRSNHKKRKKLASDGETVAKMFDPSVDSSVSVCNDFQDDDEVNLEENAARMLSSRFDPNCTGFPSKSRRSTSPSVNGLSFLVSSGQDFTHQKMNSLDGSESASADTASRVLRPRKQQKEEGVSRKRRHFYEIISRDLNAYWVLSRRIKVFWPLDESWYYGLVNDYDPERNLHHIKYDDRDEEWVNLRNERFKLLLFPSEVPGRAERKRSLRGNKQAAKGKRDPVVDDDSSLGNHIDSEPIISWLARSSRRVKSSATASSKKQKISNVLSDKTDRVRADVNLLEGDGLPDRSADFEKGEKSVSENFDVSRDGKSPVVYVRRRVRRQGVGDISAYDVVCRGATRRVTSLSPVVNLKNSKAFKISYDCVDREELLWFVDNAGLLKLCTPFIDCKQFRFELCLPATSLLEHRFAVENIWLFHTVLLLQYGTIMTLWPIVYLEMLFVDNYVGLRFLLFEGGLKQAIAFVFLVLTIFCQPDELEKFVDVQLPVTSVRFKLSCAQDLSKQHIFVFYSFSRMKCSKWMFLDYKLEGHCHFRKQLPLSECTYDNIKTLERGSNWPNGLSFGLGSFSLESLPKKSVQGVMPMEVAQDFCNANIIQGSDSDLKRIKLPPFALSFAASPSFFIRLHLKLLMERSIASISLRDRDLVCSIEHSNNVCPSVDGECGEVENLFENVPTITAEGNVGSVRIDTTCSELLTDPELLLVTDSVSRRHDESGTSGSSKYLRKDQSDASVHLEKWRSSNVELKQFVSLSQPLAAEDHALTGRSTGSCHSNLNDLSIEIPSFDLDQRSLDVRNHSARQPSDLASNMRDVFAHNPNPVGSRSFLERSCSSASFGDLSNVWPDGKTNFISNGFGNGPRKPRTQVKYTLPFGGFEFNSKHKTNHQKARPYQRIRRANEKRASHSPRTSQRNLELLACDANVLVTIGDRGWRESGARVILELADHNEWRLAVKLSGATKYSCKVHNVMLPGSTNRYTHAMMWKGGKDWILEFPDRSQWSLFKEMHEECRNRNIHAASVRNIPIPGVRLIEENDDNVTEVPFVRGSPKYFHQTETDVDMALNPLRILYDLDSDDEQWLKTKNFSDSPWFDCEEISEELFEKVMDMLEKVAYTQQRDHFSSDEIEELMGGVGHMAVVKVIYEHWQQKRFRKGMPLIRQLQPPLWEKYQQQLKEWEQTVTKVNNAHSSGCQGKVPHVEKPLMFAFCLKPRGLEVPHKGSKQRSQKKFPVSVHNHAVLGDQDGLHALGRRLNGFSIGDEKVVFHGNGLDSSDASPSLQASGRVFSPWDGGCPGYFSLANDVSEWKHRPKLHRNKSKKIGAFSSPNSPQVVASYNHKKVKRNGVHWWNDDLYDWSSRKHYLSEQPHRHAVEVLDGSDFDEFKLHDASGAAQHALNMAKLKRERAQRLLYRADLAIHKAVVALMTAEAIKAASESSNDNGY